MSPIRPQVCDRARWYASLELDGELAELERALLDAHASRCAGCRAYRAEVERISAILRATVPERPRVPVSVRAGRRAAVAMMRARAVTAAAATLVIGFGTALSIPSPEASRDVTDRSPTVFMPKNQLEREVALILRASASPSVLGDRIPL